MDRPAILAVSPSLSGGTVLVDGGANTDCKPRQLVQFAHMGAIYAEKILGIATRPRVGVLSNGEEESKGNDLTREALGMSCGVHGLELRGLRGGSGHHQRPGPGRGL